MKVGILTHHWLANFGANLQALATFRTLRQLGHEPIVINYRPDGLVQVYDRKVSSDQQALHQAFCDRFLVESELCQNAEEMKAVVGKLELDAVVSGSDAVLRLNAKLVREDLNFPNPFWLGWADDLGIRTGFLAASSMGSFYPALPAGERAGIRKQAEALDLCSVRDEWTRWMLRSCGVRARQIQYCPDPTCMLPTVLTDVDLPGIETPQRPYILLCRYPHVVTDSWLEAFVADADAAGFDVVGLPHPETESEGPLRYHVPLPLAPMAWYEWIARSSGYVGVRFHPIMISQTLGKPFVALDDYDTGFRWKGRFGSRAARALRPWSRGMSKTYDLCRRVGLEEFVVPTYRFGAVSRQKVLSVLSGGNLRGLETKLNERPAVFKEVIAQVLEGVKKENK